jgi:uncharacterized protein YbbC (DUF1343 family)
MARTCALHAIPSASPHPNLEMRRMPRHALATGRTALLALALTGCQTAGSAIERGNDTLPSPVAAPPGVAATGVQPGLEVLLRDSAHLVRDRRVGLITNHTGVTREGQHAVDYLRAGGVNLVALFGPEHGVRGDVEAGLRIEHGRDPESGIPVYSLYGQTQRPTPEMLRDVDVLLFDIQDIGARPYTYVWTMAMAMEAARDRGIPFVVLDRPNPITARAGGPVMQREVREVTQVITGYWTVPLRHGMTAGEVARYYNADARVGADLRVVPAEGWRGGTWFDETGLGWLNPSPNIRSLDAALKYSGLVLAEATNLSVGRGTETPFSYLGAPWMDAPAVLEAVARYQLPGVRFDTVRIVPSSPDPNAWVPFRGETVRAVRITVTDRDTFDPPYATLVLLTEIRRLHPGQFRVTNEGFTQMIGSRWARRQFDAGADPRTIQQRWTEELGAWAGVHDRYRLYPR